MAGEAVELVIDAQVLVAGISLQLAVQHVLQWRRDPGDRAALAFARLTLILAVALVANDWVHHATPSTADVASFVRTVALVLTAVSITPVAARLSGRPTSRWLDWSLWSLCALRVVLWPTTDLISRHEVDPNGDLLYGPLVAPISLPIMVLLGASLVRVLRGWTDRGDRRVFMVSIGACLAMATASIFADGDLGLMLIAAWLVAPVIGLQTIVHRHLTARAVAAAELTSAQEALTAEQRRATDELARAHARTRMALRSGSMGWWEYDLSSDRVSGAPELWEMLGEPAGCGCELSTLFTRLHPDDRSRTWNTLRNAVDLGFAQSETRWLRPGAEDRWLEITAARTDDEPRRLIGIAKDITARKLAEVDLRHRVDHDELTGLSSRVVLRSSVEDAMARGDRFAVLLLDLDRFKEVNNSLGHPFGDRVLKIVAARLLAAVHGDDVLCRLGGDEFALFVPADEDAAISIAHGLLQAIVEPVVVDGVPVSVRASIGIVLYPDDGNDFDTLLRRADAAMYRAKLRGNTWKRSRIEDELGSARRLELAAHLPGAILRQEIQVEFQPTLHLASGRARSAEALARWRHGRHGVVSPLEFVPLAENYGLGLELFRLVLRRALEQLAIWRRDGLLEAIAVNLSPHTLLDPALLPTVVGALLDCGVPAEALVLEITEDSFIEHSVEVDGALEGLRRIGVQLAIDDFGAGYSSLAYLKRFDVDHLKLDRSFLVDLEEGTAGDAVVGLTIDVAHLLGLTVVAEGVEDEQMAMALRRHGCDTVQGFWWCRPAPARQLTEWLIARRASSTASAASAASTV